MGYAGSWRTEPLPPGWAQIRLAVLARDDGKCQWRVPHGICGEAANEVDHIRRGGGHDLSNLRSLCSPHHKIKSSGEGGAAAGRLRREIADRKTRVPERHPGLK
jgi:5-methylcytosine-specific restriction enzyme A